MADPGRPPSVRAMVEPLRLLSVVATALAALAALPASAVAVPVAPDVAVSWHRAPASPDRAHAVLPDGNPRVTSWSRNVVEVDPIYQYNCHDCAGNASITVKRRGGKDLVGKRVLLSAQIGPHRSWVTIAKARVEKNHSFRLENDAIAHPIPGRVFALQVRTRDTATTSATRTPTFETRGWHTFSLDEFAIIAGGLQRATITEPDGSRTVTSTVFSPTTGTTSFDIGGQCRALWTKIGLDPYTAQPTDLRSASIGVDGTAAYTGVVGKYGTYAHTPGITMSVLGASTLTIGDAPYPGGTGGPAWFDAFVTCSF